MIRAYKEHLYYVTQCIRFDPSKSQCITNVGNIKFNNWIGLKITGCISPTLLEFL